jgi:N-acetylmuramoyl-L-alanine amidase
MIKKIFTIILVGVVLCFGHTIRAETRSPDINCLARAIYAESGGENIAGQYAIGEVVVNRINAGFASSACAVINQHRHRHWQFGFRAVNNKTIPNNQRKYFINIAQDILSDTYENKFPANVLYFNNRKFNSKHYRLYKKIGHQMFYIQKSKK